MFHHLGRPTHEAAILDISPNCPWSFLFSFEVCSGFSMFASSKVVPLEVFRSYRTLKHPFPLAILSIFYPWSQILYIVLSLAVGGQMVGR